MSKKIMIQTQDKTFFVHKKNLPMLIEFAKTFKARLAIVEVSLSKETELEELASKFCDQNSETVPVEYEILQELYPNPATVRSRSQILADAKTIKKFIRDTFSKNGVISLKDLRKQFDHLAVTDSCLSNHLSSVRKEFIKQGKKISIPSKGTYELV